MDTTINDIKYTNKTGFWNKLQRFFLRMGYLRAMGELHRMGRSDLAKNLEIELAKL